jgi:hypothetical protein
MQKVKQWIAKVHDMILRWHTITLHAPFTRKCVVCVCGEIVRGTLQLHLSHVTSP